MKTERVTSFARRLLREGNDKQLKKFLLQQDFHVIGHVINQLENRRRKLFVVLPPEVQAEVVLVLTDTSLREVFESLSPYTIARFMHFNDEDEVVDILHEIPEEKREHIIDKLKIQKRKKIEKLLKFGSETAGGLMDLNFILVKPDFTFKEVAAKVQKHIEETKQPPLVVVTRISGEIEGYIPYKSLILTPPLKNILPLVKPLPTVPHTTDQEKIISLISRKKSDVVGVVDEKQQILGVIHVQDLLRVAQAEATEDVFKFAGVSTEEDVLDPARVAIQNRYRWLILNLGTAFLASLVVSLFEGTIARLAVLAAYMPIVAGMGGNAGTQTLAVVVRGLALGHITWGNAKRTIIKEISAGLVNGLIVGIIIATVVTVFRQTPLIGLVLGFSMMVNLVIAGLFGTIIPLSLRALNIDPAIASSVFVTTATDIFGFFVFLGLATLLLV